MFASVTFFVLPVLYLSGHMISSLFIWNTVGCNIISIRVLLDNHILTILRICCAYSYTRRLEPFGIIHNQSPGYNTRVVVGCLVCLLLRLNICHFTNNRCMIRVLRIYNRLFTDVILSEHSSIKLTNWCSNGNW